LDGDTQAMTCPIHTGLQPRVGQRDPVPVCDGRLVTTTKLPLEFVGALLPECKMRASARNALPNCFLLVWQRAAR